MHSHPLRPSRWMPRGSRLWTNYLTQGLLYWSKLKVCPDHHRCTAANGRARSWVLEVLANFHEHDALHSCKAFNMCPHTINRDFKFHLQMPDGLFSHSSHGIRPPLPAAAGPRAHASDVDVICRERHLFANRYHAIVNARRGSQATRNVMMHPKLPVHDGFPDDTPRTAAARRRSNRQ